MLHNELKSQIDKLWEEFWTGGITNPLSVIEQISFLMFARLLDINETKNEKRAKRTNKAYKQIFSESDQDLRWSQFQHMSPTEMLPLVRDRVFPHFKTVALDGTTFGEYMKDAQLLIQKPTLLDSAVSMINDLPLTKGDTKGDLYEYLLGKLTTAGINGQFRTPRHIIRKMVEMLAPKPTEQICDPACGTAGFLVEAMHYLLREMLRISAMNLLLHGIDSPDIHYQDTLSNNFPDNFPQFAEDSFDVILANPPFKGMLDFDDVHPSLLSKIKTKKTELLFVTLILKMLKLGGRSATIVPDGVLFGSSKAHQGLRKMLVDENQLEAVISLPSGVFKPYAGVSTAIIVFTKGGQTEQVFFYDVEADGYSLDDKRDKIETDDLSDMLTQWQQRDPKQESDRTAKHFFVHAKEIRKNKYDLSINRYKEIVYEEEVYDPPEVILDRMVELEKEIMVDMDELRGMLG